MTSPDKSLRLGRFRAVARDILMRDREAKRLRWAVNTSGSIARALERAYQEGRKDAEAGPADLPAPQPRALQWAEIPRRAADLLEAALPSSKYDSATKTATLDLAQETGLFLAVGTGPDARYRVAWAGPRWKGQLYLQEGTYSPRFFQTLLRMDTSWQPARCPMARERWRPHPWPSPHSSTKPSGWRERPTTASS